MSYQERENKKGREPIVAIADLEEESWYSYLMEAETQDIYLDSQTQSVYLDSATIDTFVACETLPEMLSEKPIAQELSPQEMLCLKKQFNQLVLAHQWQVAMEILDYLLQHNESAHLHCKRGFLLIKTGEILPSLYHLDQALALEPYHNKSLELLFHISSKLSPFPKEEFPRLQQILQQRDKHDLRLSSFLSLSKWEDLWKRFLARWRKG